MKIKKGFADPNESAKPFDVRKLQVGCHLCKRIGALGAQCHGFRDAFLLRLISLLSVDREPWTGRE